MTGPLAELRDRWDRYTGDREFELDVRAALRREGYRAGMAVLRGMKLAGASRAGWVQVYRFTVETATERGQAVTLLGLGRDDAREGCQVRFFEDEAARGVQEESWCEDLVRPTRREHQGPILLAIAGLGVVLAGLYVLARLIVAAA